MATEPNFVSLNPIQVASLGGNVQDATKMPNTNSSWYYYNMKRKDGVEFKIAPHNLNYHLDRGFVLMDNTLHYDDPSTQVHAQMVSPSEQMVEATKTMAEAVAALAGTDVETLKAKRGRKPTKKAEDVVAEEQE